MFQISVESQRTPLTVNEEFPHDNPTTGSVDVIFVNFWNIQKSRAKD